MHKYAISIFICGRDESMHTKNLMHIFTGQPMICINIDQLRSISIKVLCALEEFTLSTNTNSKQI